MKKIGLIFASLLLPAISLADDVSIDLNPTKHKEEMEFLNYLGDWAYTIGIAVASGAIIVGALMMVMAAGNPEKFKQGKKVVVFAILGLVILMASKGIIAFIKAILSP